MPSNKIFKTFLSFLGIGSSIAFPISISSCVYLDKFQKISVTDSNVFFSDNNWLHTKNKFDHDIMCAYPGGSYIKVAFYGNTIGIDTYCFDFNTNNSSSFPKLVILSCYIDGSDTPIVKHLSEALGNILIFSDSLKDNSDGLPHTAKICISIIQENQENKNRFSWPNAVVVQNILIEKHKTIVDPTSVNDPKNPSLQFKRSKNVLIYGDSLIECSTVGSDYESNAKMWEANDYEYSLVGLNELYLNPSSGSHQQFYDDNNPLSTSTLWNRFNDKYSRLDENNKFTIKPDLIVLNIGTNDALNSVTATDMTSTLTKWINHIASLYDNARPNIMIQTPYLFDNSNYQTYREAYTNAYKDLFSSYRVSRLNMLYLMDLSLGADWVVYYQSDDKIHPNKNGCESLTKLMEVASTPTNPTNVSISVSESKIKVQWSNPTSEPKYSILPIISSYEISFKKKDQSDRNEPNHINYDPNETSYVFESDSLETGDWEIRIRSENQLINKYSDGVIKEESIP